MTIPQMLAMLVADLLAISILTFGIYRPRHQRRDLITAYLGINAGVFVVSAALASSSVGAGLGLGLLGVLSIVRLRSDELSQREIAYYFAALAIGLLGGLAPSPAWLAYAGMALVVVVMYVADHPGLAARSRSTVMVLDRAIHDETALREHVSTILGHPVVTVTPQKVDLVNDTTVVDVRYRLSPAGTRTRGERAADAALTSRPTTSGITGIAR